jgi:hypothetical protein
MLATIQAQGPPFALVWPGRLRGEWAGARTQPVRARVRGGRGQLTSGSEEEQKAKGDGAGGVEQDIAEGAVAVGQEGLVEFVGAGDEEGGGDGEAVGGEAVTEAAGGLALDDAEGAEADEREETIAHEVAGFADGEVDGLPIGELIEAKERFGDAPERSAGVIGAAPGGGFKREDEQAGEDGEPCAQPERG